MTSCCLCAFVQLTFHFEKKFGEVLVKCQSACCQMTVGSRGDKSSSRDSSKNLSRQQLSNCIDLLKLK